MPKSGLQSLKGKILPNFFIFWYFALTFESFSISSVAEYIRIWRLGQIFLGQRFLALFEQFYLMTPDMVLLVFCIFWRNFVCVCWDNAEVILAHAHCSIKYGNDFCVCFVKWFWRILSEDGNNAEWYHSFFLLRKSHPAWLKKIKNLNISYPVHWAIRICIEKSRTKDLIPVYYSLISMYL